MTTPNEIALYGLSADGMTLPVDNLQTMSHWQAQHRNEREAQHSEPYRWVRVSSLPAALNAVRNEKAVESLRDATRPLLDYLEAREKAGFKQLGDEIHSVVVGDGERFEISMEDLRRIRTILSEGVNLSGSAE